MKTLRAFAMRLRDLFRRREIARAFEEEMAFHRAELERQHLARGASPEEARAAAARDFGNEVRTRENLREQAGFPTWDELVSDCRHAARGLGRRPALTLSVMLILALGLGAAATIHGLIDAVFLRPLPVPYPEQLYAVTSTDPKAPSRISRGAVRRLEAALPERSVAGYGGGTRATVRLPGQEAVRAGVRLVTGSFFATLGVNPTAGRLVADADDVPGAPTMTAVAGYAWAKKNFGTPQAAVGRELIVNRTPIAIIGVLPESFREIDVGQQTDLWFATAIQPRLGLAGNASITASDDRPNDPDWNREERVAWLSVLVRVRPGSPPVVPALQRAWSEERDEQIRAASDSQSREAIARLTWTLVESPGGQSRFRESFRTTGRLLAGVVAVMLVLVCTNVSGLLLVRAMSRHREIGVRLALGAGSLRVVRLGFLEAAILSVSGGILGFLLAMWLLPFATRLLAPAQDLGVALGAKSILIMTALALVVALFSALTPALWISRVEPLRALSGNRGLGRAPVRLGRTLVVVQFTLAVALVAVAAALGGELQRLLAADPGFAREQVMTAIFDPASAGYKAEAVLGLAERLRTTLLGVPGVKAVSFSSTGILAGSRSSSGVYFHGPGVARRQWLLQHDSVLPGYFAVVGVPLVLGHDIAEADGAHGQRTAVINATLAREVFHDANSIGQTFSFDPEPSKEDWTIVGVIGDGHINGVRERVPPMFYLSAAQWDGATLSFLAVRFTGPEAAVQANLRAALARAEPGLVFASWKTLERRIADDVSGDLATTKLAGIFSACAIVLAGAGVAGSLGYLVVLRQRELALRMAIGAASGQVLRSVLLDALRLGALGGAIGLALVWLIPKVPAVRALLHEPPGLVPACVAVAIALATALVAGWIPARRAAQIDPLLLLKSE
jgi:predicted permease